MEVARKMEVACSTITRLRDKAEDVGEEHCSKTLARSMANRLQAVFEAKRGPTKY